MTASDQAPAGARIVIPSSGPRNFSPHRGGEFLFKKGFEGRAGQSNSPVDCCDRERPSARRRANRNPFERAKKFLASPRRGISFLTKGFEGRAVEKSTSSEVLFSMKRTLWRMKNEAGLRPMKRGFAARKDAGASLHASAASASRKPSGFRFTFADGKRFITV